MASRSVLFRHITHPNYAVAVGVFQVLHVIFSDNRLPIINKRCIGWQVERVRWLSAAGYFQALQVGNQADDLLITTSICAVVSPRGNNDCRYRGAFHEPVVCQRSNWTKSLTQNSDPPTEDALLRRQESNLRTSCVRFLYDRLL